MRYQTTANKNQDMKYAAKRLNMVQPQDSWMEEMNRSLITLGMLSVREWRGGVGAAGLTRKVVSSPASSC